MSDIEGQKKVSKVGRKFSIGYQLGGEMSPDDWIEFVSGYRSSLREVYFAIPGDMSGRAPVGMTLENLSLQDLRKTFFADLDRLKAMDISGVLLFNSACYGIYGRVTALYDHVKRSIEEVAEHIDLRAVTTLHPGIAAFVKEHFPQVKVRSSVTMQIGTIRQMEAISEHFDGFYMQRDYNRDLEHIKKLRAWCDAHGKTLHLLANSGCLYLCPFHIVHMGQTAHFEETSRMDSIYENRMSPCCDAYLNPAEQYHVLQNTWIRPEDLPKVSEYFDTVKLASRISPGIKGIIKGYCEGEWQGDLLPLLEMDYSHIPGMPVIRNDKFPANWYEQTMHCERHCESCGFCKSVFEQVAEKREDDAKQEG